MKNKGYAIFFGGGGGGGWGATKVHYRVCMRRWRIYTDCLATDLACDQVNLLCDLNCTAVRTKLLERP